MALTTQQAIVQTLRERVLSGELAPGERLVELQLAERLGVSRTPLRLALSVLATEGLLERSSARGFTVRRFSVRDILNAIDVRGVLEGLAARTLAERGFSAELADRLDALLEEGDRLFAGGAAALTETNYADLNGRFHALIVEQATNQALSTALLLNDRIPFVSPATVVFDKDAKEKQFQTLMFAHRQHHSIVAALKAGEGARVEALMKEHTNISKESLNFPGRRLHPVMVES
ncbi:GntR family transcriptional regulator [Trinickia caryophylli]|uniref:Transcriptional regulator, GntR family n=1 Tax=Trinickia caryophylli TaxID=28094 RepID=A0A1X7FDG0_TRICW|nr:GntR family transcriptional regulator [Trinickia caryophylli]PMS10871.1 GntR family transcriptional regulator [Trinickia caryophylli]TRX18814.1 GntR family transcriptional regulator [Trinickia caryophylli]WQE10387.1 GntR family transcriptional regulator [Trinickia caryophylli]SMF49975.1 transcriptional regulator, GntR family [Trinickia caryophylli]GLU34163.1 transcriptional regulator [Trinickia caryophylli]